jgi:hypothetical protein
MMYSVRRVRVPFLPVGAMVGITPLVARDLPDLTIWIQSLYIAWKLSPGAHTLCPGRERSSHLSWTRLRNGPQISGKVWKAERCRSVKQPALTRLEIWNSIYPKLEARSSFAISTSVYNAWLICDHHETRIERRAILLSEMLILMKL